MKKYKAILFDLDGTLFHINNEDFLRTNFPLQLSVLCPLLELSEQELMTVLMKGTEGMIANDGKMLNCDRFYTDMAGYLPDRTKAEELFDFYYSGAFHKIRDISRPNSLAVKAVEAARNAADYVILATLPVFPVSAQITRLSFIDLELSHFDLVTHSGNSHFCKPHPEYYWEILDKFDLPAKDCLMIGNDVSDDMEPATAAGLDCYLVTDYLIANGKNIEKYKHGSFDEMLAFLQEK